MASQFARGIRHNLNLSYLFNVFFMTPTFWSQSSTATVKRHQTQPGFGLLLQDAFDPHHPWRPHRDTPLPRSARLALPRVTLHGGCAVSTRATGRRNGLTHGGNVWSLEDMKRNTYRACIYHKNQPNGSVNSYHKWMLWILGFDIRCD